MATIDPELTGYIDQLKAAGTPPYKLAAIAGEDTIAGALTALVKNGMEGTARTLADLITDAGKTVPVSVPPGKFISARKSKPNVPARPGTGASPVPGLLPTTQPPA